MCSVVCKAHRRKLVASGQIFCKLVTAQMSAFFPCCTVLRRCTQREGQGRALIGPSKPLTVLPVVNRKVLDVGLLDGASELHKN